MKSAKSALVLLFVAACLVACNKSKPDAAPTPAPAIAPPPRPGATTAASPATAPDGGSPVAFVEEPSLTEINRALNAYALGLLKEPDTLEDLVKSGYLKRVPAPPPGKKFVLNVRKTAVMMVDK